MKERLRGSDYRFITICMVLLAGTTWFSARNFYRAFPEASIDFKVSRDDAQTLAGKFLSAQGYGIEGYRQAAQFAYDEDAKTFLEREAGLERANRIMGTRVRLWRWSYRWFRPLQKEEFDVEITPRGELAGFDHEIAEDAARPAATVEEARALAENFLRTRIGRDPATLDFVEESDVTRPHRVDRSFTWKERDFELHGATNRVDVTMLGNEPGGYHEYLKVPDQWKRDYQLLRSKNEVAQTIDSAATVVLVVGMVIVIVMRVRRRDVPWRRAALVGLAGIVLGFLAQLNEFPLHEFSYPTTDSYGSFLSRQFLNALLSALGAGGLLFILTAGAEPLYREMMGDKISLGNLFTMRGLRTKRFFLGAILGITLTGIFIAYQTAFYIVAFRYGAWSPADVPYTDLLNTKFPWAFVLFGGFLPAVSEEFLFRMFAIPFLRKADAQHCDRAGAGGLHLGLRARGLSAAAVLHSRRGSGNRRRGAGNHHAALRDFADAGVALLGGRDVQRDADDPLREPVLQALGRRSGGDHAAAGGDCAGGVLAGRRVRARDRAAESR